MMNDNEIILLLDLLLLVPVFLFKYDILISPELDLEIFTHIYAPPGYVG